jgi:hypothetical protein
MFKYTAVIIEPRKHKAFEFVLKNFFENLSDEWGFIIFHGKDNKEYIENILYNNLMQFKNRIDKIIQLDTDNLTSSQYSNICKSPYFYKCIDTEVLLIFQTDTIIINKNIINDFLQYDYVGAPWINKLVGNGGLSLRKKSKMIEITEKVNSQFTDNEDNYFCYQQIVQLNRPLFEEAQRFSVETIFHEKSFGIHACWKHLNKYELGFLIEKYPEISTLIDLNKLN